MVSGTEHRALFFNCSSDANLGSLTGMGYAAEYHVERYLRECFVPRLAPVSRVSLDPRAFMLSHTHHICEIGLGHTLTVIRR